MGGLASEEFEVPPRQEGWKEYPCALERFGIQGFVHDEPGLTVHDILTTHWSPSWMVEVPGAYSPVVDTADPHVWGGVRAQSYYAPSYLSSQSFRIMVWLRET